ncbi:MAG: ATP-grasp fold amidoligase family protein [Muribaculaceae bacterium]|nr:ATP-grasp fold amidoligase family protein [Muribaculaceae bacterium]
MIYRILKRILREAGTIIPDKQQIEWYYRLEMGKSLDLNNPMTMNEKLQWLKLYNRKQNYRQLVDKIKVKKIVSDLIGARYVVPLLGVWDKFDDIDFDSLPDQFVLKTNHSGGNTGVIIVSNKNRLNKDEAKQKLEKSLKSDIYKAYREWPYKDMDKKIFAEAYLGNDLVDYKFYCFDGDVDCVLLCIDRQAGNPKFYFFDKNWNLCRYNKRGKEAPADFSLPKPKGIDEMFELAVKMSKGFPFVRMDFFDVNGRIYFGEYTFFPASGYDYNRLPESDIYFGNKIVLPK